MPKPELFVIINSDTDPAIEPISSNFEKETVWDTTAELVRKIREVLNDFEDSYGNKPHVAWHLRSDHQMNEIWGRWNYPVVEYLSLWRSLQREGDEIGWHPHLWRFDRTQGLWYQEHKDSKWIEKCLKNGYNSIAEVFEISSSRMGWDFHNNLTMRLISKLGIKHDLSAIPGVKYGGDMYNIYDWSLTPTLPYYPSLTDYRMPGDPHYDLVEIPITTFKLPPYMHWIYTKLSHKSLCTAHPGKHPIMMKHAINYVINNALKTGVFILNMPFHPGDFMYKNSRLFSVKHLKQNMAYLLSFKENVVINFILPYDLENVPIM